MVDGDTIDVQIAGETKRVRYIGINTPETVDPRRPVEYFGKEASKKNAELVGGKTVFLEKDVSETDRYGRLLRYLYLEDGTFVNLELVKQGYAQAASYPPDVKYQEQFRQAEREAREAGRGLWADAPGATAAPAAPTRAATTAPSTGGTGAYPCQPGQIKGNRNSMIYHAPGQRDYEKTTANVQCFDTESDAQAAGYRKAQR